MFKMGKEANKSIVYEPERNSEKKTQNQIIFKTLLEVPQILFSHKIYVSAMFDSTEACSFDFKDTLIQKVVV